MNTTLCYIEKDGCYLMLHRVKKEHDISRDKWLGVGGKFEDKESPEDCLLREVREETGLTLKQWRYCGIVTFVSDRYETEWMHLFTSDAYTGNIKECDEGVLEWIAKDKIFGLPIWEGDKIFFKLMQEDRPFFSLKVVYEGDVLKSAILNGQKEWEVKA